MTDTKTSGISFGPKNVEKYLKLCKKYGVTHLKIDTLELKFTENETLAHGSASKEPAKKALVRLKKLKDQADLNSVNEEVSTMHVENPLAFENALIENEFENSSELSREGEQLEETRHSEAE